MFPVNSNSVIIVRTTDDYVGKHQTNSSFVDFIEVRNDLRLLYVKVGHTNGVEFVELSAYPSSYLFTRGR